MTLRNRIRRNIRARLISGLLIVVPLGITAFVVSFLYHSTAGFISPLVAKMFVEVPRYAVPTISVVVFLSGLYVVGVIAKAFVGRQLIALTELILYRTPVVRTVYGASKQLVESLTFQGQGANFKSAVIVDFPHPGMKAVAFVTGKLRIRGDREYYKVFIATTPNPTSGYFELVPPEHVCESDISVEEAAKLVMSGGVLAPELLTLHPVVPGKNHALVADVSRSETAGE